MSDQGTITIALQRAAIISEYNRAIEDGAIALAEGIRNNPDNADIFADPYIYAGQKVSLNGN